MSGYDDLFRSAEPSTMITTYDKMENDPVIIPWTSTSSNVDEQPSEPASVTFSNGYIQWGNISRELTPEECRNIFMDFSTVNIERILRGPRDPRDISKEDDF